MATDPVSARPDYVRRHLRCGWWSLFVFVLLGASALGRPVYARMGFEAPTEYVHFERPKPE